MITLDDIEFGREVIVESIRPSRRYGLVKRRLLDLGIIPGTTIKVVRRAPLGDPIEIDVRGCHIMLRREEARAIMVSDEKREVIPLSRAVKGRYRINSIYGMGVLRRLNEMGISSGDIIEVAESDGKVVFSKDGIKISIGFGISDKIYVEPITSDNDKNTQ